MIKIITLNLFRYYQNWEQRKKYILSYLKREKPDVVFFQECFDDGRFNGPNQNQAEQINEILNFKHCIYSVAEMLRTQQKKILTTSVFDGLGCISNIPVLDVKSLRLSQHSEDSHFRIIQKIVFSLKIGPLTVYHTHYSNRDDWARLHLKETLTLAKDEKCKPIILGDLNIKIVQDVLNLAKHEYLVSWAEKNYVSYPSKNEVLDYVLIPFDWKFEQIICDEDNLSDHRPLCVVIKKVK